jgi:zinc D-Ala-D-Ala carboxypeptidase
MRYFDQDEFLCHHCGKGTLDEDFGFLLDDIRHDCGFPFLLSSAYRCPEHPIEKRKSKPGAHAMGYAVDIAVIGEQALKVIQVAQAHGVKRIGINQKGKGRFIHLDAAPGLPSPAIWSY